MKSGADDDPQESVCTVNVNPGIPLKITTCAVTKVTAQVEKYCIRYPPEHNEVLRRFFTADSPEECQMQPHKRKADLLMID